MTGPIILGRTQAKAMGYVQFPQIWQPHAFTTFPTTLRKICTTKTPTSETVTSWYNSHHQGYPSQSISAQKWVHKSNTRKQSKQTTEPVLAQIKWNTDSIELNGDT